MNKTKAEHKRKILLEGLKQYCALKGITQNVLAAKAKKEQGYISRVLSGKVSIPLDNLIEICNAAGCEVVVEPKRNERKEVEKRTANEKITMLTPEQVTQLHLKAVKYPKSFKERLSKDFPKSDSE